jgi:hypothetical protein
VLVLAPTGLVGALEADADPAELEAVTETSSVEPKSAAPTVYVDVTAPAMIEQFAALASQRAHW